MEKNNSTPGPWQASVYGIAGGHHQDRSYGVVAQEHEWPSGHTAPKWVVVSGLSAADAELIAAAPELLEALEAMLEWTEIGDVLPDDFIERYNAARAAIDKVKGS